MKTPGLSPITLADAWFVGEDQSFRWTIYDNSQAVVDISGWTLVFKYSATQGGAAVITKTATLTTPASGICTVAVAAADYGGATPTTGWYQLRRTDTGNVGNVAWGPAVLQGSNS